MLNYRKKNTYTIRMQNVINNNVHSKKQLAVCKKLYMAPM